MSEVLTIDTERDGLVLRQLATEADDIAYFAAVQANREHLSQFGDITAQKYQTLADVRKARQDNPPNKLRFGIWDGETFVGSINSISEPEGVEIGYWLDGRHTGQGYATLATKALVKQLVTFSDRIYATVDQRNLASAHVLERSGFRQTARDVGKLVFEYADVFRPRRITLGEAKTFSREGFSGRIYVDKDIEQGFTALQTDVHGSHPPKKMLHGTTRTYYVVDGMGKFKLGGKVYDVKKGDFFVIPPGGEYEYKGIMTLFEMNVSPGNIFKDQLLEP